MNRFLIQLLFLGVFAIFGLKPISGFAQGRHGKSAELHNCPNNSKSAFPWEYINENNVKTWRFVVMNYYPDLFDQKKVESIGSAVEKFIATYFYPSWRVAVDIQYYVSPSETVIIRSGIDNIDAFNGPTPEVGTFIPVYLQDEFNLETIPDNFGTAVHGTVSGSPINGPDASFYTNQAVFTYGQIPYGTPFIVIPAGGIVTTGNGITAEILANKESGEGPTDFYQCLSLTLCHQIIEVLVNPTGAAYVGSGNPLGLGSVDEPRGYPNQIFYIKEAVTPFSQGNCNLFTYKNWTMPNFAYPAYFFPYNTSGVYDFLGRTNAPFKPYKGTQFFLYQEAVYGIADELQVGNYVSPVDDPCNVQFVLNGSIYDYEGWGLTEVDASLTSFAVQITDSVKRKICRSPMHEGRPAKKKYSYKAIDKVMASRVRHNGHQAKSHIAYAKQNDRVTAASIEGHKKASFNPKEPQLLPFQYVDACGDLVCRFRLINYIPEKLPPDQIDQAIPFLERHIESKYLPYYNIKVKVVGNDTIYSDADLPVFDGTFIPFFYLKASQFDLNKLGGLVIGGGATNVCNVPNVVAGPVISEYVLDPPALPLGNPYLMCSENNFLNYMGITTKMQEGSDFAPAAPGTFRLHFDEEALALDLRNNNIDLLYISELGTSPFPGVNNLSSPDGIAFLGGGRDALGPYWDFDIQALVANPQIGFTFLFQVVKQNDSSIISDEIVLLTDQIDALLLAGHGDLLVKLSHNNMGVFTSVTAHEMQELASDPNYATYIATSNPPVDGAILFSQYEASDPVERLNTLEPGTKKALAMNAFPIPAYFSASLRTNNYDNTGYIFRPLVPFSRQQIVYQQQGDALHVAWVLGPAPALLLNDIGSIFDGNTFYPPQNAGQSNVIANTPLSSIYEGLLENKNL